jgi:DNA repair and recombination RAD54-like protein
LLLFASPIAVEALLGSPAQFQDFWEKPILKLQSQDGHERTKAQKRAAQLGKILQQSNLLLRRSESLLEEHLPPKFEIVIRLNVSEIQQRLYEEFIKRLASESSMRAFTLLSMTCDHPVFPVLFQFS